MYYSDLDKIDSAVSTGCFVIMDDDDEYLGVDSNSGGYPFFTDHLPSATIWYRKDEYEQYKKAFSHSKTYTDVSKWKKYQIVLLEEID